jgi:hypothetical protein
MVETAAAPKRCTGLLIWMIVSQLLMVGSLMIWLLVAGLSVMAFDSGSTPEAWTFVIAVWSYPIIPLVLVVDCVCKTQECAGGRAFRAILCTACFVIRRSVGYIVELVRVEWKMTDRQSISRNRKKVTIEAIFSK